MPRRPGNLYPFWGINSQFVSRNTTGCRASWRITHKSPGWFVMFHLIFWINYLKLGSAVFEKSQKKAKIWKYSLASENRAFTFHKHTQYNSATTQKPLVNSKWYTWWPLTSLRSNTKCNMPHLSAWVWMILYLFHCPLPKPTHSSVHRHPDSKCQTQSQSDKQHEGTETVQCSTWSCSDCNSFSHFHWKSVAPVLIIRLCFSVSPTHYSQ